MTLPSLGIDISKLKFDVCLLREGGTLRHKVFPNSPAGFSQLATWLVKYKVERIHACMEATGTYGEALAVDLYEGGHIISVVNPAAIKAYGQSRLSRTKTRLMPPSLPSSATSGTLQNGSRCPLKYGSCRRSSAASSLC